MSTRDLWSLVACNDKVRWHRSGSRWETEVRLTCGVTVVCGHVSLAGLSVRAQMRHGADPLLECPSRELGTLLHTFSSSRRLLCLHTLGVEIQTCLPGSGTRGITLAM